MAIDPSNLPTLDEVRRELARRMDIVRFMCGPMSEWFRPSESWNAWRAFLSALFAIKPSDPDVPIYSKQTKRQRWPGTPFREAHVVVGRRGGKSRIAALCAIHLALKDYRPHLAPGERALIMIVAQDRKAARVIFGYVKSMIIGLPFLASMVEGNITADRIPLSNGVDIEIQTASFRGARSHTVAAAICDEIAFWRSDESANPDSEIIHAIRPGMATIPGALLLCLSSPYARRGVLFEAYDKHFGQDDNVLVWNADTQTMHPGNENVDAEVERAFDEDPIKAASEYGQGGSVQFRKDIERFLTLDMIRPVMTGREMPPQEGIAYRAFVDPSGGVVDSMTLAIGHRRPDRTVVLDYLREVHAPFSPDDATHEFARTLKSYGIARVKGDKYGGQWPREKFGTHGIIYEVSDKPKSEIYLDFLPLVTARRVELYSVPRLETQMATLERRTGRSGRDTIDHPPGGHDDVVNACAGVCVDLAAIPGVIAAAPVTGDKVAIKIGGVAPRPKLSLVPGRRRA